MSRPLLAFLLALVAVLLGSVAFARLGSDRASTPAAATLAEGEAGFSHAGGGPRSALTTSTRAPFAAPAVGQGPTTTSTPVPTQTPTPRAVTLTPLAADALGGDGFNGDVWAHKGIAYVGTWGAAGRCPASGVKIVDLADPARPQLLGSLAPYAGTSQEDVVVRAVSTSAFRGDLLAVGIQSCGRAGRGGLALFDVSDPRAPRELAFFPVGGGLGVHELDLVAQGDRVLALLAVPDSERSGAGGDVRIVDVTDPTRPVQLADWGARRGLGIDPNGGIGCSPRTYDHSVRASNDGQRLYASYWDAGVVILDISRPAEPRPLGRIAYPPGEEGAAHSVAESADGRTLLVMDENDVFRRPANLTLRVQTADGPRDVTGCDGRGERGIDDAGPIEGELVAVGPGCTAASLAADPRGRVALVDDGGCPSATKAATLAAAGARAVVLANAGDAASPAIGSTPIPIIGIAAADAAALRGAAAGLALPVTLPAARPWGGVHIVDLADLAAPRQVAKFQSANSLAFPPPGAGYYTVHNAQLAGGLAFASWYSDGLRVVDLADPAAPREIAAYVPPPTADPQRSGIWPSDTYVWGVALAGDLVLLSDINSGLHILRWTEGR